MHLNDWVHRWSEPSYSLRLEMYKRRGVDLLSQYPTKAAPVYYIVVFCLYYIVQLSLFSGMGQDWCSFLPKHSLVITCLYISDLWHLKCLRAFHILMNENVTLLERHNKIQEAEATTTTSFSSDQIFCQ